MQSLLVSIFNTVTLLQEHTTKSNADLLKSKVKFIFGTFRNLKLNKINNLMELKAIKEQ